MQKWSKEWNTEKPSEVNPVEQSDTNPSSKESAIHIPPNALNISEDTKHKKIEKRQYY